MLFQFLNPTSVLAIFIPMIIVAEIVFLKIGLISVKAEEKNGIKWVAISILIQLGAIFFVSIPLILMGMVGEFGQSGPDIGMIILIIAVGCFLDFNLINMIHRLGFKRTLIVFIFFLIPLLIIGSIMGGFLAIAF